MKKQQIDPSDIKSRYTVLDVWRMLLPHSAPLKDGLYHSPFRDDTKPSFSVYSQGRRFRDHANDEHRGDCIDFYGFATGCTVADALAALAEGISNRPIVVPAAPPRRKQPMLPPDQRVLEQQSIEGIVALVDADSVASKFLRLKGIPVATARSLHREGSFGCIDGKPVYHYPFGLKIRHDYDTSRSSRWLCGSPEGHVWRHQVLASPHIKQVILTEGESDCMRLISLVPQGLRRAIVAIPGASWRPTQEMLHYIGAHRQVTLWLDNDKSGKDAADRLEAGLAKVAHCNVRQVQFAEDDANDICAMEEWRVMQIFADFCCA
jgi:5S rRNA maturation endonuclease (ribonuclease M5)